jgi:hypothetical protein
MVPSASFQILCLDDAFFSHFLYSASPKYFSSADTGLMPPDLSTCSRDSVSAFCVSSLLTEWRSASVVGAERSIARDALLALCVVLRVGILSRRAVIKASSSTSSSGVAASLASYDQLSICKLLNTHSEATILEGISLSRKRKAAIPTGTYLQAPINPLLSGNLTTNFIPLEQLLQQFISLGFGDLVVQIRTYVCCTIWPILGLKIRDNELVGIWIRRGGFSDGLSWCHVY